MNIASYDMLERSMKDTPADSLIRLIYVSEINTTESSVFEHIQSHSEVFNKKNNIVGFLCNNTENFLQCLEGTKAAVTSLMQRIFKDTNHKDVDVVFAQRVGNYSFTDWRMHSLNLSDLRWKQFSTHVELGEISPFKPEHWPYWFVEHFIECVKTLDYSTLAQDRITFDSLGYSEVEKKLASDNVLFYIFLCVLIGSTAVILLYRYDVVS